VDQLSGVSKEAIIFSLGALISLISTLSTVIVTHILTSRREDKNRRREVLERVGTLRAKRGELTDGAKYNDIVKECTNLPDDVISVYLGALKEWTK
jgi:hypothetical protein